MYAVEESGPVMTEIGLLAKLVRDELERRWDVCPQEVDIACGHALLPMGKIFRPILLLEAAVAAGGDPQAVLPAAVGAECGHVASLIHDDIIDGDDMRRGRPAAHSKFGTATAILAGDLLIFHLFDGLARCRETGVPDDRIALALGVVAQAGIDMCRGQGLEAELGQNAGCTVDDYLRIIQLKTASFFRAVCQVGAVLGGGGPAWIGAAGRYGERLGVAFQIHDDLLGYTSDTLVMGKAATSDIRNRRFTLPVIYARGQADAPDRRRIDRAYSGELGLDEALASLRDVLTRTGGIAAAERLARDNACAAKDCLRGLPASPSRESLAFFATAAADRRR